MLFRLLIALVFFIGTSLSAVAETWALQRTDGDVRVSVDGRNWNPAQVGAELASGTWISTGPRSRAILGRGEERIVYRADTLAALSISQPTGQKTRVTHQKGSVFLSVVSKKRQRTSVVTPHLAAVIKGTVLEVTTDAERATVRVDKGLVEVRSEGRSVEVSAGREAIAGGGSLNVVAATTTSQVPGSPDTFGLQLNQTPAALENAPNNPSARAQTNRNGLGATNNSNNSRGDRDIGNGIGNGAANGVGNGAANGVGNGAANGVGNGAANGVGNGAANGVGNGAANGVGNGAANGVGYTQSTLLLDRNKGNGGET